MRIVLGTRTSALAQAQTDIVAARLRAAGAKVRSVPIATRGDAMIDRPIAAVGGKGIFTEDLEAALRSGEIDAAVHSLKDLPTESSLGLVLGAVLNRQDARDVLVAARGLRMAELPNGARVGTSSVRRKAQLLAMRPDLEVVDIRGNVPTRVEKVDHGDYDATVLAAAGLIRLGLHGCIAELFDVNDMVPAPGQGALAVQCREDHATLLAMLHAFDDPNARATTTAERTVLSSLGGGCSAPLGANCSVADRELVLRARVSAADGSAQETVTCTGAIDEAEALGRQVASDLRDRGVDTWL